MTKNLYGWHEWKEVPSDPYGRIVQDSVDHAMREAHLGPGESTRYLSHQIVRSVAAAAANRAVEQTRIFVSGAMYSTPQELDFVPAPAKITEHDLVGGEI